MSFFENLSFKIVILSILPEKRAVLNYKRYNYSLQMIVEPLAYGVPLFEIAVQSFYIKITNLLTLLVNFSIKASPSSPRLIMRPRYVRSASEK